MIHETGQGTQKSLKDPIRLDASVIGQAILVKMSPDVDDERYILTTMVSENKKQLILVSI